MCDAVCKRNTFCFLCVQKKHVLFPVCTIACFEQLLFIPVLCKSLFAPAPHNKIIINRN